MIQNLPFYDICLSEERLIFFSTDTGKVLLLDSRIVTKKYGKIFVESLPGGKIDYKQDYDFIN